MQILMYYWLITGVLTTFIVLIQFLQIDAGDWKWYSGMALSKTIFLVLVICLLFGSILLPLIIIDSLYKLITGEDLIKL